MDWIRLTTAEIDLLKQLSRSTMWRKQDSAFLLGTQCIGHTYSENEKRDVTFITPKGEKVLDEYYKAMKSLTRTASEQEHSYARFEEIE